MYINRINTLIYNLVLLIVAIFFTTSTEAFAKLNIVTSFSQDASFVEEIAGDRVSVSSLTNGLQDPHAVKPKPSIAVYLKNADLLIVNGQQMEISWLPAALATVDNPKIMEGKQGYLDASKNISLIPYTQQELEGTPFFSKLLSDDKKVGNHHYWLDPANGLIIAKNIYEKLAEMDEGNAEFYRKNYEDFIGRLTNKIMDWDAMMAPYKGKKIISYHRDWIYLANRHGLNVAAYIEPRETIPPSAEHAAKLVKKIIDEKITLILISPWQPQRISHEVARQSNATILSLPSAVDPRLGTKNYIQMFDVIYTQLSMHLHG